MVAIPFALAFAYGALKLLGAAASDCQAYEAGDRFGLLFFVFPLLASINWLIVVIPSLAFRRWSIGLGFALGLALVSLLAWTVIGGAPETIRKGGDLDICPGGVPDWWPGFLPR